jgi:xylan 1,4-beta-xylosidase
MAIASGTLATRQKPDIDALAMRSDRDITVLTWNCHDDDAYGPAVPVRVSLSRIPAAAQRALPRQYRIDQDHSNAYTVWKRMAGLDAGGKRGDIRQYR